MLPYMTCPLCTFAAAMAGLGKDWVLGWRSWPRPLQTWQR